MSDFDGAVEALWRLSYERRIFALAESVSRDQDPVVLLKEAVARPAGRLNRTVDQKAENGAISSSDLLPDGDF